MLTKLELMIMKESVKGHDIIYLIQEGREYVFRTLGIKEYNDIKLCVHTDKDLEDGICQSTLLYPPNIKFSEYPYAGIIPIASEHILKASGFDGEDIILDRMNVHKEEMKRFDITCMNMVKAAFPEYNYDEILEWSWPKLIDYAVRAEVILQMQGSEMQLYDTRNFEDEDEEEVDERTPFEKLKEESRILREYGIDPMIINSDSIINKDREIVDFPLVGGLHWQREDVLNAIRGQVEKRK